jgi:hypothetical protein
MRKSISTWGCSAFHKEFQLKAFQAYATGGSRVTRPTPREAAVEFFEQNPSKRKCNVTEGETDGQFFTVKLGLSRKCKTQSWEDVTKKTAQELPGTSAVDM